MEFMIEIVVTAFAIGGILWAIVALHLSANLKHSDARSSFFTQADSARDLGLQRVPIKSHFEHPHRSHHRNR